MSILMMAMVMVMIVDLEVLLVLAVDGEEVEEREREREKNGRGGFCTRRPSGERSFLPESPTKSVRDGNSKRKGPASFRRLGRALDRLHMHDSLPHKRKIAEHRE